MTAEVPIPLINLWFLLLPIEVKATPNGNPSNDFYWWQKSSFLSMLCILTLPVSLTSFTIHVYIIGKILNNQAIGIRPKSFCLNTNLNKKQFFNLTQSAARDSSFKAHQLGWLKIK